MVYFIFRDLSSKNGGEIFFGGSDPNYYNGNITYAPLIGKMYWKIKIDRLVSFSLSSMCIEIIIYYKIILCFINSISTSSLKMCHESCQAIVDTGTAMLLGPSSSITKLNAYLGSYKSKAGLNMFNCNETKNLPSINKGIACYLYLGITYISCLRLTKFKYAC